MSDETRRPLVIRHFDVGAAIRPIEQPRHFTRSMGSTPLYPPLSLVEPDMGMEEAAEATVNELLAAQDDAKWGASWFARYLGSGDAA